MATASPPRPLVFISASHKDTGWRDRLKAALEIDDRIQWWDDSRIDPGRRWADEIQEALTRASVAVVLLSPEYLTSRNAMAELLTLAKRAAEPGDLTDIPSAIGVLMPFYGPTPDEAAPQLTDWLSLAYRRSVAATLATEGLYLTVAPRRDNRGHAVRTPCRHAAKGR